MKASNLDFAVTISRALGHPARLRALNMLRSGELCICQITEVLHLAQSTVSTHLRELKRAGLIDERKQGRWVFVAHSDDPETAPWIDASLRALEGDGQLRRDDHMVEAIRLLPLEDVCRLGYEAARVKAGSGVTAQNPENGPRGDSR